MAEHLADTIRREETWNQTFTNIGSRGGRARAQQALQDPAVRTPEEVRRADATVAKVLDDSGNGLEKLTSMRALASVAMAILAGTFVIPAFFAVLGALIFGTGFTFRLMGAALVNRRGQPISRLRALARAVVTWLPAIVVCILLKYGPDVKDATGWRLVSEYVVMVLFAAAAGWAIARPSRALQDRIAGTWIVPR